MTAKHSEDDRDREFEEWRRRDEQRQREAIENGELTPYDLAVGELGLSLSLSKINGMIFGSHIAKGLGQLSIRIDGDKREALEEFLLSTVDRARNGDKDAMSVCGAALFTYSKNEQPAPEILAKLACDVMNGRVQVKQPRGRPKKAARDNWIRHVINSVAKAFPDMHITRNEATAADSVCSIVARATTDPRCEELAEKGGLSEKAVERIWTERNNCGMF